MCNGSQCYLVSTEPSARNHRSLRNDNHWRCRSAYSCRERCPRVYLHVSIAKVGQNAMRTARPVLRLPGVVSNIVFIVVGLDEGPRRLVIRCHTAGHRICVDSQNVPCHHLGRRRWHGRQVRKDMSHSFAVQTCLKSIFGVCLVLPGCMDAWLPEPGGEPESLRHWRVRQMGFQEGMDLSDSIYPRPGESMRPERIPERQTHRGRKRSPGLRQLQELLLGIQVILQATPVSVEEGTPGAPSGSAGTCAG